VYFVNEKGPIDVSGNYVGINCHYYAKEDTVVVTGARYLRKRR